MHPPDEMLVRLYLTRLGLDANVPPPPTIDTLRTLIELQLGTVPFENVSMHRAVHRRYSSFVRRGRIEHERHCERGDDHDDQDDGDHDDDDARRIRHWRRCSHCRFLKDDYVGGNDGCGGSRCGRGRCDGASTGGSARDDGGGGGGGKYQHSTAASLSSSQKLLQAQSESYNEKIKNENENDDKYRRSQSSLKRRTEPLKPEPEPEPPIVLDIPRLMEKILLRNRGGCCLELNGLFAEFLSRLGYGVRLVPCWVYAGRERGHFGGGGRGGKDGGGGGGGGDPLEKKKFRTSQTHFWILVQCHADGNNGACGAGAGAGAGGDDDDHDDMNDERVAVARPHKRLVKSCTGRQYFVDVGLGEPPLGPLRYGGHDGKDRVDGLTNENVLGMVQITPDGMRSRIVRDERVWTDGRTGKVRRCFVLEWLQCRKRTERKVWKDENEKDNNDDDDDDDNEVGTTRANRKSYVDRKERRSVKHDHCDDHDDDDQGRLLYYWEPRLQWDADDAPLTLSLPPAPARRHTENKEIKSNDGNNIVGCDDDDDDDNDDNDDSNDHHTDKDKGTNVNGPTLDNFHRAASIVSSNKSTFAKKVVACLLTRTAKTTLSGRTLWVTSPRFCNPERQEQRRRRRRRLRQRRSTVVDGGGIGDVATDGSGTGGGSASANGSDSDDVEIPTRRAVAMLDSVDNVRNVLESRFGIPLDETEGLDLTASDACATTNSRLWDHL